MKTWTFTDKSKWPLRGEWDTEPDKVQWIDETTGLDCMAIRARSYWCGYVGIPDTHAYAGKSYEEANVDVHGGLTFAGYCDPRGHSDTEPRICHIPEPGTPDHVYWLGFDCAHSGDFCPPERLYGSRLLDSGPQNYEQYRPLSYVQRQCEQLAAQLKAVA